MAEFLILGGILAFGYQITQNSNNEPLIDEEATQSNVLSVDVPMNNVLENQQILSHRQLQDNFELNVRQHMNSDDVVTNYNQPFFKSGRSQNTNENYKDTKLGIFTGVENLDFQKKEVPMNTFSPVVGQWSTNTRKYFPTRYGKIQKLRSARESQQRHTG